MANTKVITEEIEEKLEVEEILRPSELPMNIPVPRDEKPLVTNDEMTDMYKKIFSYCEEDRKDADEGFKTFMDLVLNDGDASHSTKEAMVQLLKIRTDSTDKMTKVMDLLMRYILKERDTFPRYLAQHVSSTTTENNIIFKGDSKRSFLDKLEKNKARKVENH